MPTWISSARSSVALGAMLRRRSKLASDVPTPVPGNTAAMPRVNCAWNLASTTFDVSSTRPPSLAAASRAATWATNWSLTLERDGSAISGNPPAVPVPRLSRT